MDKQPSQLEAALRRLLDDGAGNDDIRQWLHQQHPADVARVLRRFRVQRVLQTLAAAPPQLRGEIFGYLDQPTQIAAAEQLDRPAMTELFLHMSADERADLYNALDPARREHFMPGLAHAEREDIRTLAAYPEGSTGAIMTSEYALLPRDIDAAGAIGLLRAEAPDKETIYYSYVVDAGRRLLGTVSLRELILAPPDAPLSLLMNTDSVWVAADAPRSEAARLIREYDLLAIPVLDADRRLVGIVTYDDAMDVADAEAAEDFLLGGAVAAETRGDTASWANLYRRRVGWLVLLVFGNLFSGAGIAHFEDTIASHMSLLFFLPLLIASAGNAGSQSATLMVRAMATGQARPGDWGRMLAGELGVSLLLGLTMALAIAGVGLWRAGGEIASVVAVTMVIVVMVGSLIGMSLPFLLSRFRLDPATASAPLVTSIADVAGVMIYFGMARVLLAG